MAIDNMSFGAEDFPQWVWNKETGGGGIFTYNNIHGLDRLMWLVGSDIVEVHGRTGMFAHEGDAEDNAVASLLFENGAIGASLTNFNPYEVPRKVRPGYLRRGRLDSHRYLESDYIQQAAGDVDAKA